MSKLQWKFEDLLEDVNQEDGIIQTTMEKMLEQMFFVIKWAGIPFVLYLLFEISRW